MTQQRPRPNPQTASEVRLPSHTGLPPAHRPRSARLLLGIIGLSLIPALLLAVSRINFENSEKTVALVMDYPALSQQAKETGQTPEQLLNHYKSLGINGVALYEDVVASSIQRGNAYFLSGAELQARNPWAKNIDVEKSYMRSITAGTVEKLRDRYNFKHLVTRERIGGQTWYAWPVDPRFLPAGPNTAQINTFKLQGYVVVYRPYADQRVLNQGADWPQVPFISFNGNTIMDARTPEAIDAVKAKLGSRIPTIIEGINQKGMNRLVEDRVAARMFSLNPTWQNNLLPDEVASKYALAARERTQRILYIRPFPTVAETDTFLTRLGEQLNRSHIQVTTPQIRNYEPSPILRSLAMLGPLAALVLLGLSFPLPRLGLLVTGLAGLGALAMNGLQPFPAFALIAAMTFPALGTVMLRERMRNWFVATGFSLLGVLFVSALGTDKDSMLGLDPFKGVGLTLLVPLIFVALSFLPQQDIRKTAYDLFRRPFSTGDLIVMVLGAAAFSVAFLRRGNTSSVGISPTEAKIRQDLQDAIIRPRFKEVFGHPLLLLGLSGILPGYLTALSILGGVMGQASILNTFSHFHTPLLISATRAIIGLLAGLVFGIITVFIVQWLVRKWNTYGGWSWEKVRAESTLQDEVQRLAVQQKARERVNL